MMTARSKVLLSWSSGKDSAWALHVLRQQPDLEVVGLLTTFNEEFDRVAMHAVRRELVEAQAAAAGLPLVPVMLPYPCTNEVYEERMRAAIAEAKAAGVTHMAFGDLFLEDIREYRVRLLEGTGVEPLFPIWTTAEETPDLARRMLAAGLGAVLTCVDPKQLSERFVGRQYDETLLAELPAGVDPCGERGEFHTFCYRCPEFSTEIPVTVGDIVERDGFWFADLRPAETRCERASGLIGLFLDAASVLVSSVSGPVFEIRSVRSSDHVAMPEVPSPKSMTRSRSAGPAGRLPMASKTRTSSPPMKPIRSQMRSFPRGPRSMIPLRTSQGHPCPDLVECYTASDAAEAKFIADQLMEQGIPAIPDKLDIDMVMGGLQAVVRIWSQGPCATRTTCHEPKPGSKGTSSVASLGTKRSDGSIRVGRAGRNDGGMKRDRS